MIVTQFGINPESFSAKSALDDTSRTPDYVALSEAKGPASLLAGVRFDVRRNERAGSADSMHGMMNADRPAMAGPDCERLKYIYCREWQFIYSSCNQC